MQNETSKKVFTLKKTRRVLSVYRNNVMPHVNPKMLKEKRKSEKKTFEDRYHHRGDYFSKQKASNP